MSVMENASSTKTKPSSLPNPLALTKMKTYTVIYTHRHGVDSMLVKCSRFPSKEEVVAALDLEYEPERDDEFLEIELAREPVIIP